MVDYWTHRTSFTDAEIIEALRQTPLEKRMGNLWTFFDNLPRPEKERLVAEANTDPVELCPGCDCVKGECNCEYCPDRNC